MIKKIVFVFLMLFNISFADATPQQFTTAYQQIKLMLEGKLPISYRKAIFLVENAYMKGTLDEQWYNQELDKIIAKCKAMIAEKGLQNQKTAPQWAIFGYMCKPLPHNNNSPYSYDYESLQTDATYEKQLVTHLLKTGKGNCYSLPMLFLILSQEMKAESFLAKAPMHYFIKHKDDKGEWWNLELTSGSFSRTAFIIESFGVTDKQIESGYYMKPLNEKETLASILESLFHYYDEQTGKYYDDFSLLLAETGLKYNQVSSMLAIKADALKYKLDADMAKQGLNNYDLIKPYPSLVSQKETIDNIIKQMQSYGYKKTSLEWYQSKVKEAFNYKETVDNK